MNFVDIIIKKRNNEKLTKEEIYYFVNGAANLTIPDYQLSSLLMAICIRGLDEEETSHLIKAMTLSGEVLDLSDIKGIKVDKHSTGGVGDTTTLVLAPLVASLGLPVIKMSGRGLGHTGGTLDKLESIPNFNVNLTKEIATKQVNKIGIAIMGQTAKLVPADKVLYQLRDVTGTVESIPLIASSIMSKKIAGGADGIVLDVKLGKGAFMKNIEDARNLGDIMIKSGKILDKKMSVLITDMNEPLGLNIGNSLEVIEAIEILKGNISGRLKEVSLSLAQEMLVMGEIAKDYDTAYKMLNENINNGKAIEKLEELILSQGGNANVIYDYSIFDKPKESFALLSDKEGYINEIDAYKIGQASVATGAGRITKKDNIDPSAGIIMNKKIGDEIRKGEVIAKIFASTSEKCENASEIIKKAVKIGDKPNLSPVVYEIRR
ncbi:MAG: thymidine phosphorylase [Lachnospirales bacterium]